ncbi:MAG: DMT family transporter [Micromonosporaceae bacterium]|nr:DMT family transporter [Micromonosporaceae bacterium]
MPTAVVNRPVARPTLGATMVVAAATAWGLNGTVSKLLIQSGFDPPQLTAFRAAGAALGLLLFILVTQGPRPLAARPREIPWLVGYGLIGLFSVPVLYFVAISRLPVGIGLLFEFTAPVFVALWVRFGEHRRVRRRLWVGLVLAVAGLVCVAQLWTVFGSQGGLRLDGLGILAGLSSAVLLAAWWVLGSRYVAGPPPTSTRRPTGAPSERKAAAVTVRDPLTLTCWAFGTAAVAGAVVRPWWNFDWGLLAGRSGGQPTWLLATYFILFGTITPYLLLTYAMRHLPPTSVGIVSMTEIVLASAFAWLLLAEALNTAQIIGGLVLVAGVALAESARVTGLPSADASRRPGDEAGSTDHATTRPADDTARPSRPVGTVSPSDLTRQPT